jgi:hypothetical protein
MGIEGLIIFPAAVVIAVVIDVIADIFDND